ncbi:MAG: hypothetical protein QOE70_1193 [Chthoniobacter sp.]|jgi:hypothetical protein|nr:hypothetical protein [Chthoniobacter sp.]
MATYTSSSRSRRGFWAKILASKFLVVSIVVHLLFGVGATYLVVQIFQPKRKLQFAGGPPAGPSVSKRALEHQVSMAKKTKTMSAPAQAKRITTVGLSKIALPDMPNMPTASVVVPQKMIGMGGFGPGVGAMGGGAGGGGGGGGSGINFFGLRATARDVVFCIDISASMVTEPKNPQSYARLEDEVSKVIRGLNPLVKFGIVAFAHGAEAYKPALTMARTDEKEKAIKWLKSVSPVEYIGAVPPDPKWQRHKGTHADQGLAKAFSLKPDTIFFVSDGDPSGSTRDEVIEQVAELQKTMPRSVTIHAVSFMPDGGQEFLQELSSKNRGTFREVN